MSIAVTMLRGQGTFHGLSNQESKHHQFMEHDQSSSNKFTEKICIKRPLALSKPFATVAAGALMPTTLANVQIQTRVTVAHTKPTLHRLARSTDHLLFEIFENTYHSESAGSRSAPIRTDAC